MTTNQYLNCPLDVTDGNGDGGRRWNTIYSIHIAKLKRLVMCLISHLKPISRCGINYLKICIYPISSKQLTCRIPICLSKIFFKTVTSSKKPFLIFKLFAFSLYSQDCHAIQVYCIYCTQYNTLN